MQSSQGRDVTVMRRSTRLVVAASVLGVILAAYAQNIPTIPPVIATAPRIGGGTIICRGYECRDALSALQAWGSTGLEQEASVADGAGGLEVSKPQLCSSLKNKKPQGCNFSSPPASPGITVAGQAPYEPNGCGTGVFTNWLLDKILEISHGQSYSGDLNEPYEGVSFRAACNAHDVCWASGGDRGQCDLAFQASTWSACSAVADPNGTCRGWSSSYHGAVSNTNASHSAYETSTENRQCALWAMDMRENGCAN